MVNCPGSSYSMRPWSSLVWKGKWKKHCFCACWEPQPWERPFPTVWLCLQRNQPLLDPRWGREGARRLNSPTALLPSSDLLPLAKPQPEARGQRWWSPQRSVSALPQIRHRGDRRDFGGGTQMEKSQQREWAPVVPGSGWEDVGNEAWAILLLLLLQIQVDWVINN